MFEEMYALFKDLRLYVIDLVQGRDRDCMENSVKINAPRAEVWETFWTSVQRGQHSHVDHYIEEIGRDLYRVSWSNEGIYQSGFMKVIEAREPDGFLAERYYEEGDLDTEFVQKFGVAFVESEDGQSTEIRQYDYVEDLGLIDRLLVSFESRWMLRAFKDFCEAEPEPEGQEAIEIDEGEAFWAVFSSAVAFFGCWFFYDFSWAVLIMMALVFHEVGHVLALNLIGFKTPGISILPFVGGGAMNKLSFKSDLDQAFCSLMGAVISLAPCSIFFMIYLLTDQVFLGVAAAIFAFVNLLSLLPIYPFDGGRILDTLMSTVKYVDVIAALGTAFIVGFLLAVYNGYFLFALIGIFTLYCVYQPIKDIIDTEINEMNADDLDIDLDENGEPAARMSYHGALVVFGALSICISGYAAILYTTMSDANVKLLLGYF